MPRASPAPLPTGSARAARLPCRRAQRAPATRHRSGARAQPSRRAAAQETSCQGTNVVCLQRRHLSSTPPGTRRASRLPQTQRKSPHASDLGAGGAAPGCGCDGTSTCSDSRRGLTPRLEALGAERSLPAPSFPDSVGLSVSLGRLGGWAAPGSGSSISAGMAWSAIIDIASQYPFSLTRAAAAPSRSSATRWSPPLRSSRAGAACSGRRRRCARRRRRREP